MATGDITDIAGRVRSILPPWFPVGASPVLDALVQGVSYVGAWAYSLTAFVSAQARIATASGGWLDMLAFDYFGRGFTRVPGWSDAIFAALLGPRILRPAGTRAGLAAGVFVLTGRAPVIVEPWRPADTGVYGGGGGVAVGYGTAGAWGSMQHPNQLFMQAFPPAGAGIPSVAGYGNGLGGYGTGAAEWGGTSQITGIVTPDQIYAEIANLIPAGTVAWVRLASLGVHTSPLDEIVLDRDILA